VRATHVTRLGLLLARAVLAGEEAGALDIQSFPRGERVESAPLYS
jgi:hypothetical protein